MFNQIVVQIQFNCLINLIWLNVVSVIHAKFYIHCVSSMDAVNDLIETYIHCDLYLKRIQWMIWSELDIRCDSFNGWIHRMI